MKAKRGWELFERHANDVLALESTIASGSKWHDPGDGVDRRHYSETDFPLIIDAKYTESGSYAINAAKMLQWVERAQEMGKRFALPLRFWPSWSDRPEDYIVLRLDDFGELMDKLRENERHQCRCPACGCDSCEPPHA
jgi:hypothetical protein